MKIKTLKLFNGWLEENIAPCDWSNQKRWKNYLAIVSMNNEGEEEKYFLSDSKESDLYFNISDVKPKDILLASCWDDRKKRQYKQYYIVLEVNPNSLILSYGNEEMDFTTYRKTYKGLMKYLEEQNKKVSEEQNNNIITRLDMAKPCL